MRNCEGNCEDHCGDVILVNVVDAKSGYDWGLFWYCEEARRNDLYFGFLVTPVSANSKHSIGG